MNDKLNEECGVFGIFNHKDVAVLTQLGLYSLQHRFPLKEHIKL